MEEDEMVDNKPDEVTKYNQENPKEIEDLINVYEKDDSYEDPPEPTKNMMQPVKHSP